MITAVPGTVPFDVLENLPCPPCQARDDDGRLCTLPSTVRVTVTCDSCTCSCTVFLCSDCFTRLETGHCRCNQVRGCGTVFTRWSAA
jgi:hypothetical protein